MITKYTETYKKMFIEMLSDLQLKSIKDVMGYVLKYNPAMDRDSWEFKQATLTTIRDMLRSEIFKPNFTGSFIPKAEKNPPTTERDIIVCVDNHWVEICQSNSGHLLLFEKIYSEDFLKGTRDIANFVEQIFDKLKNQTIKKVLNDPKLIDLKNHLERQYGNDGRFFYGYVITGINFNGNARNPELKINVSYDDAEISLLFRSFEFYFTSGEDISYCVNERDTRGFAFLSIYQQSNTLDAMLKGGYQHQFHLLARNIEDYFFVSITCQNYFIQVYTDTLPEIVY
ncbi:hypothetical protein ACI76W_01295 [Capnocytophaga canimorsus]|uniref:hypothetical protein n=1 Tax=Capnocytophaga canimorsus TaxID=28188 RepID=UPI00385D9937